MRKIERQVEEYYRYCEWTRGMAEATMRLKRGVIGRFVEFVGVRRVEDLENRQIDAWMARLAERGLKGRSVNDYLAQVVAMLRWQVDMGVVMPRLKLGMIMKQKEMPARRGCYEAAEVQRVLERAGEREWLMVSLSFDCGLRIDELRRVKFADIQGRRIVVVGKGAKRRFVFMSRETWRRLRDYSLRVRGEYLWPGRTAGQPMTTSGMRKAMRRAFEVAGVEGFYPHALRHSFATDLQKNGASIGEICLALGHASEVTTERYLHGLEGCDVREIWEKYKFGERN